MVRPQDLPDVEPPSPFRHLDERKVAIYENLRDLQFEYRLGKLSDEDYKSTKKDLQRELAAVLAAGDKLKAELQLDPKVQVKDKAMANGAAAAAQPRKAVARPAGSACAACGAKFEK